jgi:excinuclease ABC subunit C
MDERIKKIKDIISKIPNKYGIYKMLDKDNNIIYVGKAINLKKRVSQYFNKTNKSIRIIKMTELVQNIEYVVTSNEVEALVLECNYIKEYNPKFNVMLKDDKSYPYIKINIKDKYPTIRIVRKKVDDGSEYFGPYTSVTSIKEVLKIIKEIFPVKRCKYNLNKVKVKPCLYYHIGRCLAPCNKEIDITEYNDMINQIIMFLNGRTKDIENNIKEKINICIENLEFEKASKLKLRLDDIYKISMKQKVDNLKEENTDVIGCILNNNKLYIHIFKIRGYKVVLNDKIELDDIDILDLEDIIVSCISQYYNQNENPSKIYIELSDKEVILLNKYLLNTKIMNPKKGDKHKLIEMVKNNIKGSIIESKYNVVEELNKAIKVKCNTIECYDISNLKNDYIVGAMIRVEDRKTE